MHQLAGLVAGRVAEQELLGVTSTGALNDLERLTKMAYGMVTYYGMSDQVGHLSFYDSTGNRGYELTKPYSEKTAELIDKEVKDLVAEIHNRTRTILLENKEGFMQLAALLLEKEVIFADDLENIFGPRAGAKPQDQENTVVEDTPAEEVVTEEVTTEE
jgi:cell division protease FtsH